MGAGHRRVRLKHSKGNIEPCDLMCSIWDWWRCHQSPHPSISFAVLLNQLHSCFPRDSPTFLSSLILWSLYWQLSLRFPNFMDSPLGSSISDPSKHCPVAFWDLGASLDDTLIFVSCMPVKLAWWRWWQVLISDWGMAWPLLDCSYSGLHVTLWVNLEKNISKASIFHHGTLKSLYFWHFPFKWICIVILWSFSLDRVLSSSHIYVVPIEAKPSFCWYYSLTIATSLSKPYHLLMFSWVQVHFLPSHTICTSFCPHYISQSKFSKQ